MTKTEQLAAALVSRGYKEIPARTTKYRCFYKADARFAYLWLGKSAALRGTSEPKITGSFALTEATKARLLETLK
jgi:hypothetical protein